jgi:flagellar L-ring protein precursor FlgH
MNTKKQSLVISVLFVLCFAGDIYADSIWAKRDQSKKNLYAEDKARYIGDVLTIKVSEISSVNNKGKRSLSKTTARGANFDGQAGIEHLLPKLPALSVGAGTTHTNTLEGKADNKDDRSYTDSVSVIVIDIMPNGNLVVSGTRERNVGDDIQLIEVTGIVKPNDIAADNTIRSEQVANFSIVSRNKGVAAPYMKPNWLGKIIDVIWPF